MISSTCSRWLWRSWISFGNHQKPCFFPNFIMVFFRLSWGVTSRWVAEHKHTKGFWYMAMMTMMMLMIGQHMAVRKGMTIAYLFALLAQRKWLRWFEVHHLFRQPWETTLLLNNWRETIFSRSLHKYCISQTPINPSVVQNSEKILAYPSAVAAWGEEGGVTCFLASSSCRFLSSSSCSLLFNSFNSNCNKRNRNENTANCNLEKQSRKLSNYTPLGFNLQNLYIAVRIHLKIVAT